ncbi:MAG: PocR ligand-binding domain-containing protein [Candidatus Izemoplasmatales bacterium]|nr:PocR ligand-binding domain-containing protein [Candidatus Izemoplasmatales bacterium]MDD3865642.1 PocR ligand-binding domain-containing protein [Candidatus Izemoplasmatales bacterium]
MKVEFSPLQLEEVLNFDDLKSLFANFSKLTGIDVSLHSIGGDEVLSYRINPEKSICELVRKRQSNCNPQMKYAGMKAADLGEPYIFQCGTMIKCSVPILFEEKYLGSLACGPVLLWEADEIAHQDLITFAGKYDISPSEACTILSCVKQLTPENMRSAAQMLSIMVTYMCKEESIFLRQRLKLSKQQNKIAELMNEKRLNAISLESLERRNKFKKYPYEMEKELIAYVQAGDTVQAIEILNGILGEIFAISSGDLDIIKANVYELTAVLMRAAVDAGVLLSDLAAIPKKVTVILADDTQYDEVCLLTSELMDDINNVIYQNRFKKQSNEHLINAINFIKKNLTDDLSLNTVASNVFVSGYYLSHLFRDEMDLTFSDYINKVRMEAAIKLMKERQLSIQDIAIKSGFKDAGYFTKTFKKYHGITPKKYMDLL